MESFYISPYSTGIDDATIDPDIVGGVDDDQNSALLLHDLRLIRFGTVDVQAGLTNKGCRDDKKDQHDKNHVEHGREIDLSLFLVVLNIGDVFFQRLILRAGPPGGQYTLLFKVCSRPLMVHR